MSFRPLHISPLWLVLFFSQALSAEVIHTGVFDNIGPNTLSYGTFSWNASRIRFSEFAFTFHVPLPPICTGDCDWDPSGNISGIADWWDGQAWFPWIAKFSFDLTASPVSATATCTVCVSPIEFETHWLSTFTLSGIVTVYEPSSPDRILHLTSLTGAGVVRGVNIQSQDLGPWNYSEAEYRITPEPATTVLAAGVLLGLTSRKLRPLRALKIDDRSVAV